MELGKIDWTKKNIQKVSNVFYCSDENITEESALTKRKEIEPWLSAIFQSEHLSLLIGSGLTTAVCNIAKVQPQVMSRIPYENIFKDQITSYAEKTAKKMGRSEANIEDDIRAFNDLITGLDVLKDTKRAILRKELDGIFKKFIGGILNAERFFAEKLSSDPDGKYAFSLLKTFLLSFASRASSRERLNLFSTNYDRFTEFGGDSAGIILLDRFRGKILPIFRTTRLELDIHYNPPGIRGEPRYVEGVVRITKLHGSIDWRFTENGVIRCLLPFGASEGHPDIPNLSAESEYEKPNGTALSDTVVIFPNASKDVETAFFPYAELFRDFSSAICRPNSAILTYGYGFGDIHINRILEDMLTIPSTHLVIIAWDKGDEQNRFGAIRERIQTFYEKIGNPSQFTLLIGEHFGDLETLVSFYLPKAAIDKLTIRKQKIIEERGDPKAYSNGDSSEIEESKF